MKHQKAFIIVMVLACLIGSGYVIGISSSINIPFISLQRGAEWSIGIYIGEDPFNFSSPEDISNPVLTANG